MTKKDKNKQTLPFGIFGEAIHSNEKNGAQKVVEV
ncbi:hypothetical protein ABMB67_002612 [Halalkalibacter oceani]